MKIIFSAITLKPEVVETSGWLQIIPWRNTYRNGGLRSNIRFTVLRHVTSQKVKKNVAIIAHLKRGKKLRLNEEAREKKVIFLG